MVYITRTRRQPYDESIYGRAKKVGAPFIPQAARICAKCGRRFLSGIAKIQRGYVVDMTCITCAGKPDA